MQSALTQQSLFLSSTNAADFEPARRSAAVRAALKDKGIAVKDIRSANICVYPECTLTQEAGTDITGYRA